ncbi:NAD-dependent epimerase/dehydratase family protein [Salipiger sp.]|uniref:NAD-dependent epimerase/dehydratase family protein n=1 Tax=Salipiger sp. TaxID=2078585 RepID=UPI003A97A581
MTGHWVVTGGAGFIGSHLVEHLLARGDRVTVFDNFATGAVGNLAACAGDPRLAIRTGDVATGEGLADTVAGASGVFHCAAVAGVQECIADWFGAHATNVTGAIRTFDAAVRAGRVPVVYASSAAVYGDRSGEPCREDMPVRPMSPYGADKLACEHQARAFREIHGLPTAGLRLFNVYGPRQAATSSYSGVLSQFVRNWRSGQANVIFGDGGQTRDFVQVGDVVGAMVAAMERLLVQSDCLVSNVCTGRPVSVLDLVATIGRITGGRPRAPEFRPARSGEIRHSLGDTRQMVALLGRRRITPLEEGLRTYLCSLDPDRPGVDGPMVRAAE